MTSRCLAIALACALLAAPAASTWSIVLVDTATGEVAIGAATCLAGLDLKQVLPVLVVGKGGACSQAQIDSSGASRQLMWEGLHEGAALQDILDDMIEQDGPLQHVKQYGIVDATPDSLCYHGSGVGAAKNHLSGSIGTIEYSIQGNVLTGKKVVGMAKQAVIDTSGTLADRLMAAMNAAYVYGGDGRCSCAPNNPTGCGVPPPSFEKTAHIGFMVVARPGDTDGICFAFSGCANGEYWMDLNVPDAAVEDLDPVLQLQDMYADFLQGMAGHPDGLLSLASFDDGEILGDGASTRILEVALVDIDGFPIRHGGALLEVVHAEDSAGLSSPLSVLDHGDGTYTLTMQAGAGEGTDRLQVSIDDGTVRATVYPFPELVHRPALVADGDELSVGGGSALSLDLLGPTSSAGRPVVLRLSAAGTSPGQGIGSVTIPLNLDRVYVLSPTFAAKGVLQGSPTTLDGLAHGSASLTSGDGLLAPLIGWELWCAWHTVRPVDFASNPISFEVVP